MIISFVVIAVVVGIVTSGLKIRFDRFFTILMLMFVAGKTVTDAVNIFLWVIMLGALMVILDNKDKIAQLPKQMKMKLFGVIPLFTLIASFIGSWLFVSISSNTLIIILGILAILFGLRLVLIHFKPEEMNYEDGHPMITKLCGLFGPWLSGFFIGLIGTSLKPIKIAFAIKVGKMNIKKVYLGNVITTFFASVFTLFWHFALSKEPNSTIFYEQMIYGMAIWTGIHYMYELSNIIFKAKWQKVFQIIIGIALVLVSIKIFALI